jgi:misacylated tRNA(Ala) deacylase
MAIYLCHEQPNLYEHSAVVLDRRPGAVALDRSAFHPGGGGQVGDVGSIECGGSVAVTGIDIESTPDGDVWWHVLGACDDDRPDDMTTAAPGDAVGVRIDADHRRRVASLHTMSHVLNALVFDEFEGSLVTGASIGGDGTGRMDFDLSAIDNDRLRALAAPVNDVIARGLAVESVYVSAQDAAATPGLVRSLSVAPPPTPDGRLRLIDIDGLDRQACGGTHLSNTAESPAFRITKIENKGKRNRRIRFAFGD